MSCPKREEIFALEARLLSAENEEQVAAHLSGCASCRTIRDEYRRVDEILSSWQPPEPAAEFDARVRQAVRSIPEKRSWMEWIWPQHQFRLGPRLWAPALAALLVVLGLYILQTQQVGNNAPEIVSIPEGDGFLTSTEQELALLSDLSLFEDYESEDYEMLTEFEALSELPTDSEEWVN